MTSALRHSSIYSTLGAADACMHAGSATEPNQLGGGTCRLGDLCIEGALKHVIANDSLAIIYLKVANHPGNLYE